MRLRRLLTFGVAILFLLAGLPTSAFAQSPGLRVQGVTVVNDTGQRFVFAGVNMEMFRDYANGCDWVTNESYDLRSAWSDRLRAFGVNSVRLNYAYRFLNQGNNLTKYLDMAQEIAKRGIYVMPSDHTYTGGVLTGASASYPMMKKIVDGVRARGFEDYLIMNPYNEPGPDISVAQWVQAQKDVLTYLRNTAGFQGIVALDGTGWSTLIDVNAFKQVMTFDASLRGGAANVIFSNHLYPNIKDLPGQIWTAARQVPLIVGELGQENPGASALDPNYVKNVIAGALNTGIPAGHNGLFAWIWAWCDTNSMVDDVWNDANGQARNNGYDADSPLTSHGVLWRDNFFAKIGPPPAITPIAASATPTATSKPPTIAAPSATPRPRTATPPPTVAPPITPTLDCAVLTTAGGKKIYICV